MARVDAASSSAPFDWNGDNDLNATMNQDVNFDGILSATPSALNGFDDWSKLRLDQTSAQGLWTDGGLKDFSGGLKDFSGGLKDFSGGLKDFSGGLKDFSGGLKDFSGGLKDFSGTEGLQRRHRTGDHV